MFYNCHKKLWQDFIIFFTTKNVDVESPDSVRKYAFVQLGKHSIHLLALQYHINDIASQVLYTFNLRKYCIIHHNSQFTFLIFIEPFTTPSESVYLMHSYSNIIIFIIISHTEKLSHFIANFLSTMSSIQLSNFLFWFRMKSLFSILTDKLHRK